MSMPGGAIVEGLNNLFMVPEKAGGACLKEPLREDLSMGNRKSTGESFDIATINAVWQKARVVAGNDPNVFRKDTCGMWIKRSSYGDTSQYGWEIDHKQPVSRGGSDALNNLQPLHWENNRHKGDSWPQWTCKLTAAA